MVWLYTEREEEEKRGGGEEDTSNCRTKSLGFLLSMNNGCGKWEPAYVFRWLYVLPSQSGKKESVLLEYNLMPN